MYSKYIYIIYIYIKDKKELITNLLSLITLQDYPKFKVLPIKKSLIVQLLLFKILLLFEILLPSFLLLLIGKWLYFLDYNFHFNSDYKKILINFNQYFIYIFKSES